jgi:hypothetical protein
MAAFMNTFGEAAMKSLRSAGQRPERSISIPRGVTSDASPLIGAWQEALARRNQVGNGLSAGGGLAGPYARFRNWDTVAARFVRDL